MATTTISIGDVRLSAFCDTTIQIGLGDLFPQVPVKSWEPYHELYPDVFADEKSFNLTYMCYLVRGKGQTILVDTGIGPTDSPISVFYKMEGHLLEELRSEGVDPAEVDVVVLTHLHPDHVGWNTVADHGRRRPTFPRARYLAHRSDMEAFSRAETQSLFEYSFFDECIKPLEVEGRLELISSDSYVGDETQLIHTPGHTPGSMSVLVTSRGQSGILWGDVTAHPAQFAEPGWDYAFDMDKERARETRRQLLQRAEKEGMAVGATHFSGFWRLVRREGRRVWLPE